jgi:hypothetical protein
MDQPKKYLEEFNAPYDGISTKIAFKFLNIKDGWYHYSVSLQLPKQPGKEHTTYNDDFYVKLECSREEPKVIYKFAETEECSSPTHLANVFWIRSHIAYLIKDFVPFSLPVYDNINIR